MASHLQHFVSFGRLETGTLRPPAHEAKILSFVEKKNFWVVYYQSSIYW